MEKPINDIDLMINALQTNIMINLYRCEIKAGNLSSSKIKNKPMDEKAKRFDGREDLDGIGDSLKMKLNINKG